MFGKYLKLFFIHALKFNFNEIFRESHGYKYYSSTYHPSFMGCIYDFQKYTALSPKDR